MDIYSQTIYIKTKNLPFIGWTLAGIQSYFGGHKTSTKFAAC